MQSRMPSASNLTSGPIWIAALAMTLLFFAVTLAPAAEDAKAAARRSLERTEAARKERPNDGLLVFYESLVRLRLGERAKAFQLLRSLQGHHFGIVPVRDLGFDSVWDDPEFAAIRQELAAEEERTGTAPVAFRLTDPKLIPEGIAYDAKKDRFFLGSIAQRKIIVTGGKGEGTKDFSKPEDKLNGAVLGLTVSDSGDRLYAVVTNGFEEAAERSRHNEVVSYDLKNDRLLTRYPAPEAMQLNDLAVAPDGTVYATDSFAGSLFRKKPEARVLTLFGAAGALRGANGITMSAEGKLYVAISTGIARIDTSTGEPTRLAQPDDVVTGGCDGLYSHQGDLLGIQNVTNPGRVIRIALAEQGTRISGVQVLQSSHHPQFSEPTTGALAHDALNVIANSYVGHYRPDGTIKDAADLRPTAIVAVPCRGR